MQRVLLILSTLFALYACAPAPVHKHVVKPPVASQVQPAQPAATTAAISRPATVSVTPTLYQPPIVMNSAAAPHIALLLPLQSGIFGAAASSVQQGFMAAASLNPYGLPVRAYSNFDENSSVTEVYREALANGARAVVGPLTRNGVAALAALQNFPVPTLSLNLLETAPAHNMFFFGMAIDAEARQVAQVARQQGLQQAIVITATDTLARRLQFAFEEQWIASGGAIIREINFKADISVFSDIVAAPDTMVFFATDVEKTRQIKPFLPKMLATYATSQIFLGNDQTLINYDLDGIRFIDMPWLLQAEKPAIMIYPRANPPMSADYERLYALGVDAYRLTQVLLNHAETRALPLDGVSGRIRLNYYLFQREALSAIFEQGRAQPSDAPVAPAVQMFPGQLLPEQTIEMESASPATTESSAIP